MGENFIASKVNVNFKVGLIGENGFVIDVMRVFSPSLSTLMIKMAEIAGSPFPDLTNFASLSPGRNSIVNFNPGH